MERTATGFAGGQSDTPLTETEDQYRILFDATPDPLFVLNAHGRILDCNRAAQELYGYSRAELLSMSAQELTADDLRAQADAQVQRALATGASFAWQQQRKDGSRVPVEINARPFVFQGNPCILSSIRDRTVEMAMETARRQSEAQAQEAETRNRLLVDLSPCAIAIHQDGELVFVNAAGLRLIGAETPGQVLGRPISDFIHPDRWEIARERIARMLAGETGLYPTEDVYVRLDGTTVLVEVTAAPFTHNGRPAVQIIALDIGQRKQTERALGESEERYRLLTEQVPAIVYQEEMRDETSRMLYISPQVQPMLGVSVEKYEQGHLNIWAEHLHADDRARVQAAYRRAYQANRAFDCEYRMVAADGRTLWFHDKATVVPSADRQARLIHGVMYDITERKEAEEMLRMLKSRSDAILASLAEGIVFLDTNGEARSINAAATRILGQPLHDLLDAAPEPRRLFTGRDGSFLPVEEHPAIISLRTGQPVRDVEIALPRPDGTSIWTSVSAQPVRNAEGELLGAVSSFFDITERKQAERDLRESEERFNRAFHASPAGMNLFRLSDSRSIAANPAFLEMVGYTSEEIVGHDVGEIGLFLDEGVREDWRQKLADTRSLRNQEVQIRRKSGEIRDIVASLEITQINGDDVVLVVVNDVTERKRAEKELHTVYQISQRLRFLRTPAQLAQEIIRVLEETVGYEYGAVLLIDKEGQRLLPFALSQQGKGPEFVEADRRYLTSHAPRVGQGITGWVAQTGVSVRLNDVRQDARYLALRDAIGSELCVPLVMGENVLGVVNVETTRLNAYSETDQRLLETVAAQISVAIQNALLYEEVQQYAREMEDRVAERTAELVIARDKAEAADRIKSAFLSTMSHELRTPLNSIIGFTSILLRYLPGSLNEEQEKQLGMVRASAHHLLALINDVLDISKIEAGQMEVASAPFFVQNLISQVMDTVAPVAERKGLALCAEIGPRVERIVSDERRVAQVLLNLVSNAVKFTDSGEVRIVCLVQDEVLLTRVIDTGIGIDPAAQGQLFQPFQQIETGLTRRHDGTGLGLSISRRLIELLGGRIWLESASGQGSTFSFTLPLHGLNP